MYISQQFRFDKLPFVDSVLLFFRFIGHTCYVFKEALLGRLSISWYSLLLVIYHTGVRLLFPLVMISALMSLSIVLTIYSTLSPFNLQHNVTVIAQQILFYDLLPFLISLILSMQLGLNLVFARIKSLKLTPQETVLNHIIPILIGTNFSGLLLYLYAFNTVFVSIYFGLRFLLKTDIHQFIFHITSTFSNYNVVYSIFKTILYCTMVSVIVGYYYYMVAVGSLSVRKAMSRIMTRAFLWLTISSIYFKLIYY